jgi:4-hydroxy-L-threonine phosphate dehydrogenase PdxA
VNCWEEEVEITPGEMSALGGKYALISLEAAVAALKNKQIDGLVTAPIHKKNIQSPNFNFSLFLTKIGYGTKQSPRALTISTRPTPAKSLVVTLPSGLRKA